MGMPGSEAHQIVPVGRDVFGADSGLSGGLMAGKRGMDGSSAAYDMKSLGRHIEAVSAVFCFSDPCCFLHGRAKFHLVLAWLSFFTSLPASVLCRLLTSFIQTTCRSLLMARK